VTPGKWLERSRVTSSPTIRLGVDIGGTFTDVALEIGERRVTGKNLTTPHPPEEGVLAAPRSGTAAAGTRAPRGAGVIHRTPRPHAPPKSLHRPQGRHTPPPPPRGVRRRGRDPPRNPLRAVRRQHRSAAAARSPPVAPACPRADRCARRGAGPARRSERRPCHRGARCPASRGRGGRAAAQLHQSGSRAPPRRRDCPPLAAGRSAAVLRGLAGDARIRALLHRLRKRLSATPDRALPREARPRASPRGLSLSPPADDLGRGD